MREQMRRNIVIELSGLDEPSRVQRVVARCVFVEERAGDVGEVGAEVCRERDM